MYHVAVSKRELAKNANLSHNECYIEMNIVQII